MTKSNSPRIICCSIFEEKVRSEGRRGISIIPHKDPRFGIYFVLLYRALAPEDEGTQIEADGATVTLAVKQAIGYCPWCGRNLKDFYKNSLNDLPFVIDEDSTPNEPTDFRR